MNDNSNPLKANVNFFNPLRAEVVRADGTVEELDLVNNGVVDEGFEHLLGVAFRAESQISSWYMGLITSEGAGTPVLDPSDTMASHAWSETTTYSEANRVQWSPDVVTSQSIANTSAMVFSFNANSDIRGIFVTSSNVKGGASGTLWATALFNANMTFTSSEVIRLIYTVSAS
jgi:hypothetical protein